MNKMEHLQTFESFILNESSDIDRISKEYILLTKQMKDTADLWKKADAAEKSNLINALKEMTAKKKDLEKKMNDAVSSKDKEIELVITEE